MSSLTQIIVAQVDDSNYNMVKVDFYNVSAIHITACYKKEKKKIDYVRAFSTCADITIKCMEIKYEHVSIGESPGHGLMLFL